MEALGFPSEIIHQMFSFNPFGLNCVDKYEMTPLHSFCENGYMSNDFQNDSEN